MTTHVQQTLTFPWQGGRQCSLQLLSQPWICAQATHYGWVDRGSAEYEVCPTLLHIVSTGNRTPYLLILSPTPYPFDHMLPQLVKFFFFFLGGGRGRNLDHYRDMGNTGINELPLSKRSMLSECSC